MPALFTRISRRPLSLRMWSRPWLTAAASATSNSTNRAAAPLASTSCWVLDGFLPQDHVIEIDGQARLGQGQGNGPADAPGAAGHQGYT